MTQISVSSCKVVLYRYVDKYMDTPAYMRTDIIEIQREVLSFEFSKNKYQASGTFTIQLTSDKNWKEIIRGGDWLEVYLSNEGEWYQRMLGNVDRVSQFTTKNDKGLLETSYIITGRDFGKALEKYDIWFNPTNTVQLGTGVLARYGSPDYLVGELLKIFSGGAFPLDAYKNQPQFNQWLIPSTLASKYSASISPSKIGGVRFYDILIKDLQKLSGRKTIQDLSSIQGNLWEIIKANSNDVVTEMFLELYDKPTLTLRTLPFAKKSFSGGSIASEVNYFTDLPMVTVNGQDIIGTDLGTSDEDRHNLFLLVSSLDIFGVEELLSLLKRANSNESYPRINLESISRNGLRLNYLETHFALTQQEGDQSKLNPDLLYDWNNLLFEIYNNSVYLESGTIEIIRATPEIKLGKTLLIDNSTINEKKIFYIDGYRDNWTYPGTWTQSVELSRGHFYINGREAYSNPGVDENTIYSGITVIDKRSFP